MPRSLSTGIYTPVVNSFSDPVLGEVIDPTDASALFADQTSALNDLPVVLVSGLGTGIATFLATPSSANLAAAITDETGSGPLVFATSPTLTTPTLGVASATSINRVAITAPASSATLTIANGKTLTASNTLTFTGTDSSSVAFGTGGTIQAVAYSGSAADLGSGTLPSARLSGSYTGITGVGILTAGTWNASVIPLAYGGSNANLTASLGGIVYSTSSAFAVLSGTATGAQMLQSGASGAPVWSTATWPATVGSGSLLYASATNIVAGLATAANGVLVTNNSSVPSVLAGPGVLGAMLQSTAAAAPAWSTATWPATVGASSLLYANGANTVAGLATANNGVLITSSGGVPSISSTLPNAVQDLITRLGTISSGTWQAGIIASQYGGSGINNGTNTLTLSGGTFTLTSSAGNVSVVVPVSGTLTTIENTWPSFNYYGGVSGGSTAVNNAAVAVVEALTAQQVHVPYGTTGVYNTTEDPFSTTDLRKRYSGPGTLASSGNQLGRNFVNSYTNVGATSIAVDIGSEVTWFNGDWSRCVLPIEYVLTAPLISAPTLGTYYQPFMASPIAIQMYAKNGSLHRDASDGTANVAPITLNVKNDTNGGGTGGLWVNVNVSRTYASFSTASPTRTTVGGAVGGNVYANADNVYLNFEEGQLSDGGVLIGSGYNVVGVHTNIDLHRTKVAGGGNPNAYWTGIKLAAGSSLVDIDGGIVAQGPFKAVFDTTCATISGAALVMLGGQGIYLNGTAKANGTGVNSVGTSRIYYNSGDPGISIAPAGQETLSVRAAGLVIDGTSGINLFGKGGTGTTPQIILVNGGSGSGGGGHFSFQANSVASGSFGLKSGIVGGTSRNIVIYMDTPALSALEVNSTTGNVLFGGTVTTFGLGGTGTSPFSLALDGGSGSGGGGYIDFQANSVEYGRFGLKSAVTGGTSRNIALYMPTPAINAIDVDATTGGVTLNAALNVVGNIVLTGSLAGNGASIDGTYSFNWNGRVRSTGSTAALSLSNRSGTANTFTWYDPDGNGMQLDSAVAAGTVLTIGASGGLVVASPTGGNKGNGTINATAVYDDNVLLTCFGIEYLIDGRIDLKKWDGYSPNGRNDLVHRFDEMTREFDPRDPAQYIERMIRDRALPGMPTEQDWKHNSLGLGEMHNRLWLSTELLAAAFVGLRNDYERRLEALERLATQRH
jgi:hypothetical protein